MKVFYNSRLAKLVTFIEDFSTIMFFGVVITEKNYLTGKALAHEETHVRQYWDCFSLGIVIDIILMFSMFAFGIQSWWMLFLILIPLLLFYILYLLEYFYWVIKVGKKYAYDKISFERQAVWIAESWYKPCDKRNHYVSFGWWKNSNL